MSNNSTNTNQNPYPPYGGQNPEVANTNLHYPPPPYYNLGQYYGHTLPVASPSGAAAYLPAAMYNIPPPQQSAYQITGGVNPSLLNQDGFYSHGGYASSVSMNPQNPPLPSQSNVSMQGQKVPLPSSPVSSSLSLGCSDSSQFHQSVPYSANGNSSTPQNMGFSCLSGDHSSASMPMFNIPSTSHHMETAKQNDFPLPVHSSASGRAGPSTLGQGASISRCNESNPAKQSSPLAMPPPLLVQSGPALTEQGGKKLRQHPSASQSTESVPEVSMAEQQSEPSLYKQNCPSVPMQVKHPLTAQNAPLLSHSLPLVDQNASLPWQSASAPLMKSNSSLQMTNNPHLSLGLSEAAQQLCSPTHTYSTPHSASAVDNTARVFVPPYPPPPIPAAMSTYTGKSELQHDFAPYHKSGRSEKPWFQDVQQPSLAGCSNQHQTAGSVMKSSALSAGHSTNDAKNESAKTKKTEEDSRSWTYGSSTQRTKSNEPAKDRSSRDNEHRYSSRSLSLSRSRSRSRSPGSRSSRYRHRRDTRSPKRYHRRDRSSESYHSRYQKHSSSSRSSRSSHSRDERCRSRTPDRRRHSCSPDERRRTRSSPDESMSRRLYGTRKIDHGAESKEKGKDNAKPCSVVREEDTIRNNPSSLEDKELDESQKKKVERWDQFRNESLSENNEMQRRLEGLAQLKPEEIMEHEKSIWTRSSPSDLFYTRDENNTKLVKGTPKLKLLTEKFKCELLERAQKVKAERPEYHPPPRRNRMKLAKHKSEVQNSSDSSSGESSTDEESCTMEELERKRMHPYRLHPEMWYNDPGEMNDGPLCRCSAKARRYGIRHGIYAGERHLEKCNPDTNNADKLFHYRIMISPPTNFLMYDYSDVSSDEHTEFYRVPRVFHERGKPLMELNDSEFKMRYRLDKHTVKNLELKLRENLLKPARRNKPLSQKYMLLLTFGFFTIETFQMVIGDLLQVDKTKMPTVIKHDEHEFIFEGFSMLSHAPLDELPTCKVIRFNIEYTILYIEEKFPENFTVRELDLFFDYLFCEILELVDLDFRAHQDKEGCPQFHFMPRFVRELPDNGREILSMNEVISYLLANSSPLIDEKDLPTLLEMPQFRWQNFADEVKGMVVTNPGMKPCSVRVDQLDRDQPKEGESNYPEIVHFGIRPPQLSYAGNPEYQKAWREYVKFRHLLANMSKPSYDDKRKLESKEMKLQEMRTQTKMKRDVTVAVSAKGFHRTGIMCDIVQHAMLIPVLVCHLRFHRSCDMLEKEIGYKFKNRFLLQLALTHPSYRENFGTNPDHARNSLTNCGIRQPEYGDRRIHYLNTRKRGINTLINIMSRFGKKTETESNITHNERLEFLGDAVVEFLSSIHLFHIFPDLEEGGLATYRAAIVQNQHLAVLAKFLNLEAYMLYAHGSDLCHDLELRHAMANCFEALMGALFLDGGIKAADKVFGETLFKYDPQIIDIWTDYPPHPLQQQEPEGDRKWISSFDFLQKLTKFEETTGIEFKHIRLLARAFTDRSIGYTNLTLGSNQRLEFLGDTVLQLIASEYLYKHFPEHHEGHLSLLRSSLVNNRTQAVVCDDLGMTQFAVYANPKIELKTKDRADLLEAFLGALYVDQGMEHCQVFCNVCFFPRLQQFIMNQDWNDPKSKLQQCCLTLRTMDGREPDIPVYKVIECKGPTNTRVYTVAVYFRGSRLAKASGHSIQQAEMNAAKKALDLSHGLFPQLDHQKRVIAKSLWKQKRPKFPLHRDWDEDRDSNEREVQRMTDSSRSYSKHSRESSFSPEPRIPIESVKEAIISGGKSFENVSNKASPTTSKKKRKRNRKKRGTSETLGTAPSTSANLHKEKDKDAAFHST